MPSLIGLLLLLGIVITNAIVLLDLVCQYRARGMDARTTVIEGGRRRLRPILMTAVATILALLPMALGLSKDSGFIAAPLAITVIGGLTSSTVLTLLLVPTLYVLVEGRKDRKNRANEKPVEDRRASRRCAGRIKRSGSGRYAIAWYIMIGGCMALCRCLHISVYALGKSSL